MSLDRRPDGSYSLSHFIVTRIHRPARRGPSQSVADGWKVFDPITGASVKKETLLDAEDYIRSVLEREIQIKAHHQTVVRADWDRNHSMMPMCELYLIVDNESPLVSTITGKPRVYFGLMDRANGEREVDQILRYHGIEQTCVR